LVLAADHAKPTEGGFFEVEPKPQENRKLRLPLLLANQGTSYNTRFN